MNRIIVIALFFLTLISCNSSSLFDKVDFKSGKNKVLFKYMNDDFLTNIEDHDFHKEYGHFYISDVETLNSLKELVEEKTRRPSKNSGFAYMINLIGQDENYFLGIYDLQNEVLFSNSYFKLRLENLEKLSDNFIKVEKLKIQFQTIPSLKKGIELLKENDFQVEHYDKIIESGITDFNGMTTIKTTREAFPDIEDIKSIERKFKTDLSSIDFTYKLSGLTSDMDSVEIQIASNKSIKNFIPNTYLIIKPYNETVELPPIEAYNLGNIKLKELFENNDIKYTLIY